MDLEKNIEDFDLVVLDLETTGLDVVTGDFICEVGALKVRGRKIIGKFHSLVNPKRSMPDQAYAVHKISDEELKDAPYFEEIADKLISFLDGCAVYAYNIKFDMGFINYQLKKLNRLPLEMPAVDILAMSRDVLKLPRYNLEAAAKSLDVDCSQGLHRALGDASIAYGVLLKLIDIFKEKGIEKLSEFISLYGLNNEVLKLKEDQKMFFLKKAVDKGEVLEIRYFSSANTLEEEEVLPLRILEEEKYPYLRYQGKSEGSSSIKISRILKVKAPKSN